MGRMKFFFENRIVFQKPHFHFMKLFPELLVGLKRIRKAILQLLVQRVDLLDEVSVSFVPLVEPLLRVCVLNLVCLFYRFLDRITIDCRRNSMLVGL